MNKNMTGLIATIFMMAACAVTPKPITEPINPPLVSVQLLELPPILKDSIKHDTLPVKAIEQDKAEFKNLIDKNNIQKGVCPDSIISLNYQWQKAYLRVVNRNLKNSDSLKILINQYGKRADAYFNRAQKLNFYAEQTKHAEVSSNWVFYTGFGLTLIFMAWNTYLSYRIKKQTA